MSKVSTPRKTDVYSEVTNNIITQLDKGVIPWRRGWNAGGNILPKNLHTSKNYRGINILILLDAAMSKGFGSGYWLTYNQARQKKGFVRKGEKGTRIVFWNRTVKTDDEGEENSYLIARMYTVFNYEQCSNLPAIVKPKVTTRDMTPLEITGKMHDVWANYPNRPKLEQGQPAYIPVRDTITMPKIETFHSDRKFWFTMYHEMIHSTGHVSRLKRDGIQKVAFGSETYSQEELVAEIGANMLTAMTGVPQIDDELANSAAYINYWRKKLSEDPKIIFKAASASQKAADLILSRNDLNPENE